MSKTHHLRAAIARNHQLAWATRNRILAALERHDRGDHDPTPSGRAIDHLIALGEICSQPGVQGCPDPEWAIGGIQRTIQQQTA